MLGLKSQKSFHNFTQVVNIPVYAKTHMYVYMYSVSQKIPLRTCGNFSKNVRNFSTKFYTPIMYSYVR